MNRATSFYHYNFTALFLILLLIVPVNLASAADNTSQYDIPISELNKVKKKTPSKRTEKTAKKRKSSEQIKEESPSEVAVPVEPTVKAKPSPVVPETPPLERTEQAKAKTAAEEVTVFENIQIHHTPYSFVVASKQTVINAVVSSNAEVKDVSCILNTKEAGSQTLKMEKVEGTLFTYSATLPGLPAAGHSLKYSIIAVDNFGNISRSKEYSTPVASYPVTPSWQIEDTAQTKQSPQNEDKKPLKATVPIVTQKTIKPYTPANKPY